MAKPLREYTVEQILEKYPMPPYYSNHQGRVVAANSILHRLVIIGDKKGFTPLDKLPGKARRGRKAEEEAEVVAE